ncbi:MAG: PQQ-dependent sugar dehydrogenase [Chloroflexi bacterium]|nr:PQQ-dependent sugar dehydrogenase [Chloroflexota bacterium]MCI0578884.1 PQQ-dependent sugar dehydrogenase [Chloroflexota bacterium]MCI0649125.1 PQQ-dependent sugar dehydrogenase [Chloroflexota bacterium]MCI0727040.1 PQQ-dependent sugar dehydrogenase [Chloroflexota bacterium]
MSTKINLKRILTRFALVLPLTLLIMGAVPVIYFGRIYLAGYLHGASVKITITPPVAPAVSRPPEAGAAVPPAQPVAAIQLTPVVGGLNQPVYLTHADGGRLFIVEKGGLIRVAEGGQLLPQPFLDISDLVGSDGVEQGLFSVAFHPEYASNGRFFVNYTNNDGHSVIARYLVSPDDPNQANESSATTLLMVGQPFELHNGGQLQFGPDGYLYIGLGDGGTTGDFFGFAQKTSDLLGNILRLDVDSDDLYAIPADNPYVDDDDRRNEIWAIGLRNPWRFSFDRLTGDLYIADVGQFTWEEVNFQPAGSSGGENYGWDILEGAHCYDKESCQMEGFAIPVAEYNHAEGGCAITGGYVYRGSQFPILAGNYFFADYCSGVIWSLVRLADNTWVKNRVYDSNYTISSFGEDAAGELYVLDLTSGSIYQLQP